MDVPELLPQELAQLFIQGAKDPSKKPVLILGAGASIPNLPSAYDLKVKIGSNAVKRSYGNHSSLNAQDKVELENALEIIEQVCAGEHITLEVLVSLITFRCGGRLDTDAMWDALCQDCQVNEFSYMISMLIKFGCIDKILTSNFDHVLEDACDNVGAEYQCVSNVQLESSELYTFQNTDITQICPFHGTTYKDDKNEYTGPFTATAAGLAKPFSKKMAEYIEDSLSDKNRPIIVFGYSGSDHFDLNPLLSSLHLEDEFNRSNWYWCIHAGNGGNCSQAVRNIFGAPTLKELKHSNALYGADTLSILKSAYEHVAQELQKPSGPIYEYKPTESTYEERLGDWFNNKFEWSRNEADDFVMDLKDNLAAAWIVSEHYRLVQMGYDEEYCFRFAGIFDINTESLEVGHYPHLAITFTSPEGDKKMVEFGNILEAARIYRIEMNFKDQAFPVTSSAMNTFIEQTKSCMDYAPRNDTERAALYLGMAIAYDYLGLIGGRHVTKALKAIKNLKRENADANEIMQQEKELANAREEASNGFEKCIKYATLAKDTMDGSLEKLIPALTWIQVGLDNMGRFKVPGSNEAIEWLTRAIQGRQAMIQSDIQQSIDVGETNIATSKVVAVDMHYPPLWRRGGELVHQVLETQGFNTAPNKLMSDLSQERQKLAKYGFETSEAAYEKFREINKASNLNFPAIFDVRVLMALAKNDIVTAQKEVENCRIMLDSIPKREFSESKIQSTTNWINNIEARIEDYIQRHGDGSQSVLNVDTMSYQELIKALRKHLNSMGLSGVKGFHYMDKNDNKRVGAIEIQKELEAAGISITKSRAHEMIHGFVRPGGELDVPGYLRFMESGK